MYWSQLVSVISVLKLLHAEYFLVLLLLIKHPQLAEAKQKAYDELYGRLDTKEGEKELYFLVRQRDQAGKDAQQIWVIKDRDGNVLTSEESVLTRWEECFGELMNEDNERERRVEEVETVKQEVGKISKDEVRKAMKTLKNGKAICPDEI